MRARELIRHVFDWEVAPGVPVEDAELADDEQ
jgi:hypothetical protein